MSAIEVKVHRVVVDGVDMTDHLTVMQGSNLGKSDARTLANCIDEYGPLPLASLLQKYTHWYRPARPVQVCDVCGCAHSLMGTMCNSCHDGIKGVHMARMIAAMERLRVAAAQCGVSFQVVSDNLSRFTRGIEPIGHMSVSIHPVLVNDVNITFNAGGPADILNELYPAGIMSTIYGRLGWPTVKRPVNAKELIEQRKTRRQTHRGPTKQGKWWNK